MDKDAPGLVRCGTPPVGARSARPPSRPQAVSRGCAPDPAASRAAYRSHPPDGQCSLIPPLRLSPAGPRCWARSGCPKCLYFSCFSKKSTQKKERKGGHPLFHPPVLSRVHTIQLRRPKPVYSGTPAPAAAPQPGVAARQGPRNAPNLAVLGQPFVISPRGTFARFSGLLSPARNVSTLTLSSLASPGGYFQ